MRKGQKKAATPGLIRKPSGIFWVVIHIPKEARKALGKTKLHLSTETRDRTRALEIWGRVNAEWRQKIRDAIAGKLRSLSDADLRRVSATFFAEQQRMGWGVSHVDLTTIRARFLEWAEDEGEIVVEYTFDNGGSEGEMAALKTLPVSRLTGADLDQATTWLLEGYVRFIENRSAAALTQAGKLDQQAAALRSANPEKIADGRTRLMSMFERWKRGQRLEQTIEECRQACEMFIEVNQDLPIEQFTRAHGVAFADHLAELRAPSGKSLAASTLAKKLSGVRAVFFVAMDRMPALASNPLSRIRLPGSPRKSRKARGVGPRNEGWSLAEMQLLFASPVYSSGYRTKGCGGEAAYWLPLLAIYSGARQSELAQLDVPDCKAINGILTFHITNEADETAAASNQEKRIKTDELGRRYVPVHRELLRLGFVEYLKSRPKAGKLFDVKPGAHGKWGEMYSKWFGRYRRKHASVVRRWADFHAFRHNFVSACRAVGISKEDREYLTGHSSDNVGGTYGTWSVPELKKVIDRVHYRSSEHSRLTIDPWSADRSASRPVD